ncbi:acyl-CoA thioesterase [Marinospirillum sp.]|uniref:acyl-CoA thioesterase n=1 Tax=Marinospirillum sp. TaxID=2183934 RepID=UPI00384F9ECD
MPRIKLEFPEKVVYCHQLNLRINDINYGQHLGHDTLVTLMHEARCSWLAESDLSELSIDGGQVGWVVAELAVNYKVEAFYPDQLSIELAIGDIGSKGLEIYHRVLRGDGKVVALAKTGMVFFDYEAHQAAAIPESFRKLAGLDEE